MASFDNKDFVNTVAAHRIADLLEIRKQYVTVQSPCDDIFRSEYLPKGGCLVKIGHNPQMSPLDAINKIASTKVFEDGKFWGVPLSSLNPQIFFAYSPDQIVEMIDPPKMIRTP